MVVEYVSVAFVSAKIDVIPKLYLANSANVIISLVTDTMVYCVRVQIMAYVPVERACVNVVGLAMRVIVELQMKLALDVVVKSVLVMVPANVVHADVKFLWMDVFRVDIVKSVQHV